MVAELGTFEIEQTQQDASTLTLIKVIDQIVELYAKSNTKGRKGAQSVLGEYSSLGNTPIDQIKRKDVAAVLDGIVASARQRGRTGHLLRSRSS